MLMTLVIFSGCFQNSPNEDLIHFTVSHSKELGFNNVNFQESGFDYLKKSIGDSEIVMFGEQAHGDESSYRAIAHIVQFLHMEMDFRVVLFESDFYGLNHNYSLDTDPCQSLIKQKSKVYPFWAKSIELKYLFSHIENTCSGNNPMEINGFDCRIISKEAKENMMDQLDIYLRDVSIDYGKSFNKSHFFEILQNVLDNEYDSNVSEPFQEQFLRVVLNIKEQFSPKSLEYMEIDNLHAYAKNAWRRQDVGKERDRQMAENLLWLKQYRYPEKKIVVIAGCAHIMKETEGIYSTSKKMGEYIKDSLRSGIYSIGFVSKSGRYKLFNNATQQIDSAIFGLQTCFPKSYDYAYLDIDSLKKADYEFYAPFLGHKNIRAPWGRAFDGVIYVKKAIVPEID